MKTLFCIPHFYDHSRVAHKVMGSSADTPETRAEHVSLALRSLITLCSEQTFYIGGKEKGIFNAEVSVDLQPTRGSVIVCVSGDNHLLSLISDGTFAKHYHCKQNPKLLGHVCRQLFSYFQDEFDLFCYIEDDTAIYDPCFLSKVASFYSKFGERRILLANRYEIFGQRDVALKVYLDTPSVKKVEIPDIFDDVYELRDGDTIFSKSKGKCSGAYFLTRQQLKSWMRDPDFAALSEDTLARMDVMEAAQLPIGGRYPTYKPSRKNPGYLEIHHVPNRASFAQTPLAKITQSIRVPPDPSRTG